MDVTLYVNGGHAFDLSGPVLDRALFHCDGVYCFPSFRCGGVVCKTVQAPHTAYRGFGGPQGMVIAEHVMDHFATVCGMSGDDIRRANMYKPGDVVPFGMTIGETDSGAWHVPIMWDRLYRNLEVPLRRTQIDEFNRSNRWLKRGLAVVPTKFGIAFTAKYMNQVSRRKSLPHIVLRSTYLMLPPYHVSREVLSFTFIQTAPSSSRMVEPRWGKGFIRKYAKWLHRLLIFPSRKSTSKTVAPPRSLMLCQRPRQ